MDYMELLKDVPEQIISAMSFTPENIPNFIALMLCGTCGYLLYVWGIRMVRREKTDPYPLMLHCWMITIDVLGTITSWILMFKYDFFWMFTLFAFCVPIWVVMEAYCIYRGVKYDRQEHFAGLTDGPISESKAWFYAIGMVIVSFAVNMFLYSMVGGLENGAYWISNPFTNYVFAIWTWRFWTTRAVKNKSREGNSMGLQIIITIQITLMWVPGLSWNLAIIPYFNQPWFYVCGVCMTALAIYNLYKCAQLPKKELLPDGRKPIW